MGPSTEIGKMRENSVRWISDRILQVSVTWEIPFYYLRELPVESLDFLIRQTFPDLGLTERCELIATLRGFCPAYAEILDRWTGLCRQELWN
jgi:hypothetical protein